MAGYIGSKSSVTLVDGYSEAEADAEFVTKTGDTMSGNLEVTGETSAGSRLVLQNKSTGVEVNSSIRNHTNNYAYMFGGTNGLIFANNTGEDTRIKLQDSNEIEFITSSTNRMVIDSSGRVGIGTNSPASDGKLTIHGTDTDSGILLSRSSGNDVAIHNIGGTLAFRTGGESTTLGGLTERMRIDSSGNVLVGKTATGIANVGAELKATGELLATVNNDACAFLNRKSSDGPIINLRKDGSTVGSVGTPFSNAMYITGPTSTGSGFVLQSDDKIYPAKAGARVDNYVDLGGSVFRYKDAYLSGGVYLGGTGAANKLDDYEEGTWTPTALQGASGLGYEAGNCIYTKIGRMVTLQFEINNLTSPNASTFNLGGLPFNSDQEGAGSVMCNNVDIPGARSQIVVYASSSNFLRFYAIGDNTTWQDLIGNNMGTSFYMIGQITYMTA